MVQVSNSGNAVLGDASQGPFDGSDDTLIGVLNSSSSTITDIAVASDSPIFGFDGDGLCTASPEPSGCPFGPAGYEGPGTSFSDITPDGTGGVVTFANGILPGQSAYFSLEEPLSPNSVVVGGPSAGEQGGATNESEYSTTCSTPRPVNCATGVFWHTFTDFSIHGRGVPLAFTRTYTSSQAASNGPLGFGWTDSYDMSLSSGSSGSVTVTQEDGSAVTFANNGDGTYSAPPRVLASLVLNSGGSYTFTRDKTQTSYNFSAGGELESITSLNGYTTTLAYSGSDLTSVTDPSGRQLTFTYSGSHIASVTDPMGRTTSFTYDGNGNLVQATEPAGRSWSFSYDSGHQLLSMTDPRGGVTGNTYNSSGQVTRQTDPDGGTTGYSYTGDPATTAGGTTTLTDPNGNISTYGYSELELLSVTKAAGTADATTTTYTYDPATLGVTSVTDADSDTSTRSYDTSGNMLSRTDALGDVTSYSYNSFNEITAVTSPQSETTSYSYDGAGNLISVTDPLGNTTSYAYGDNAHPGDVTSVTNPDGNVTAYTYDANGNVTSMSVSPSTGVTATTAYAYDPDGERTCQASPDATALGVTCPPAGSPPAGDTTATSYNAAGEVTSVTDPDGHTTSEAHDGDGNLTRVTDPDGNVTRYAYNGNNQQTKITRADGTTQTSIYDANGNVTAQTDAAGNTTHYTYNALNQVTSTTSALGHATRYTYDPAGNRISLTDPKGHTTSYSYDQANELTGISYSDGTTPSVSYTYDTDGHRATMTDGTGTTSYSYDSNGHLSSVTDGAGNTVSYGYDPAGQLTTLTYPSGDSVARGYDGAGRLTAVSDWLGHTTRFGYDTSGNLIRETYPNGVHTVTTFDHANQVASITDSTSKATLARFTYTRDHAGQVTSAATTGIPGAAQTYTYSPLNRLASRNGSAFSYDTAGNLTGLPAGINQAFNADDELTSSTLPASSSAPAVDQEVSANQANHGTKIISPALSTSAGGELLLAFVSASGPPSRTQTVTGMSGAGLRWKKVAQNNHQAGTAEIWQAYAPSPVTSANITATLGVTGQDGSITVAAFKGAAPVTGAHATANGSTRKPRVSLTTTRPHSVIWAVGENATHASTLTPASGQTVVHRDADTKVHATFWAQRATKPAATGRATVTMADTLPATGRWNLAAVEIPSATATTVTTHYSYDDNGNQTKIGPSNGPATSLGYDQANRLVSYGGIATYTYNGDGLRTSTTTTIPGGKTTTFTWDTSGTLPMMLANGNTSYIYGPNDQPIEHIRGSTVTYLHADTTGSVRMITNSAGQKAGTYTYTAYGQTAGHAGTATSVLQYDGQFTDTENGLIYLRARYYDPGTGQFLTTDPMAQLTLTPYGYASDNPLNAMDPTGLNWWNPFSWSDSSWQTAGDIAAGAGIVAGLVGICAATACIGDIAAAAGATTLEGTLTVAETTSELAETVSTGAGFVGTAARTADIVHKCPGEWLSGQCLAAAGGLFLDELSGFGERFAPSNSVWELIYETASDEARQLYDEVTRRLLEARCD